MTEYMDGLTHTKMFSGVAPEDMEELLGCIGARRVDYVKDEFIIEIGGAVSDFGVMLSGHSRSVKWDVNGRAIIISLLEKGSGIGVMLAASPGHKSTVAVQALDDVSVLFVPYSRITNHCAKACARHEKLLRNYVYAVAQKGLELHERIDCLLKPTVREKILTYLRKASREQQNRIISIPFNRNTMAEYLNIDRSALSRELSNMKKEGLIEYQKNRFTLSRGNGRSNK
jgi:CRP-like cAMP-binding protein